MAVGNDPSRTETARPDQTPYLGPHVVGSRIVVRRVLPGERGPTGGRAMTDVLGICLRWSDGECVVQPETGAAVVIALADIVSGKPVPPRPSPRLRVTPAEAQRRAGAMFLDLQTQPLGAWALRSSDQHSARRANSVLAFEPAGVPDAIEHVRAFYTPGRAIASVLCDSTEEAAFRAAGWLDEDPVGTPEPTSFRIAGVSSLQRSLRGNAEQVHTRRLLAESVVEVSTLIEGHVVATGVAGYAEDWVSIRSVEVSADHRRQGLARATMAELVGWGAELGARTACLQVLEDNNAAVGLYDSLGFTEHHRLRYLSPDPAS